MTHDDDDATVTIRGTAYDSHSGALIERQGEPSVYIADLPYWPIDMRGRAVEATGVLRPRDASPEPGLSDAGIHVHGAYDAGLMELVDARWHPTDG